MVCSGEAMPYQCSNSAQAKEQAERLRELLLSLDTLHPEILTAHNIPPNAYHGDVVFRHALESIRGTYIAAAQRPRELYINDLLTRMKELRLIVDSDYLGRDAQSRIDFRVELADGYFVAIEVKGGEGNSWNISTRPSWANEYIAWGHLDGSLNDPRHGVHAIIITRVVQDLIQRNKRFDAIIFKDRICGTTARPCPKYPAGTGNTQISPDVFLLPRVIPLEG